MKVKREDVAVKAGKIKYLFKENSFCQFLLLFQQQEKVSKEHY